MRTWNNVTDSYFFRQWFDGIISADVRVMGEVEIMLAAKSSVFKVGIQ